MKRLPFPAFLLSATLQATSVDYAVHALIIKEASGKSQELPVSGLTALNLQVLNAVSGPGSQPMPGIRVETLEFRTSGGLVRIPAHTMTALQFISKPNTTAALQSFLVVKGRGYSKSFDIATVAAIDLERLTSVNTAKGQMLGVRVESVYVRLRSGVVERFPMGEFFGITFEHKPFVQAPAPPPAQPKIQELPPKPKPVIIKLH